MGDGSWAQGCGALEGQAVTEGHPAEMPVLGLVLSPLAGLSRYTWAAYLLILLPSSPLLFLP